MRIFLVILFSCLAAQPLSWAGARVDLNSATQSQLESVKGIGPAKARAIIDYRNKTGPFKSVDDLRKVNGFGARTVEKMHSELIVTHPRSTKSGVRKDH